MAREAARVSLHEQTKTAQVVQTVREFKPTVFASNVKDFVAADVARFKAGQEPHTKIAAKSIYTNTYNVVANATPRQMGEFLGGGLADTVLFGGVAKGFTVVKGAVTSGARVAVNAATNSLAKTFTPAFKIATAEGKANSAQINYLRKEFIKQDPAFSLQYLTEIKNKPHILSQFNEQTRNLVQSEEFWMLSGRGERFEKWLQSELRASGNFKAGGKEFDGAIGSVWIEAKSGNFWGNLTPDSSTFNDFKAKIMHAKKIALDNRSTLQIHSDVRIPEHIVRLLDEKNIQYRIHHIFLEVEPCPKVHL